MHIILVSDRMATTRTFTITPRVVLAASLMFMALVVLVALAFSWISLQFRLPFAQQMIVAVHQHETQKAQEFVRENLDTMAEKLGQMQAQLLQLDTLGERIAALAGIKFPERPAEARGGQGGPFVPVRQPVAAVDLEREIERLGREVESRNDALVAAESRLMEERLRKSLLPTVMPIAGHALGSPFGWRIDPLIGRQAMHEGMDFVAEVGTPVVVAAGGVVIAAERHPQYGNLIEVDHGNDFTTRYAHLSKMLIKPGQLVKRGQRIGASGNTGRSTGPHLHFEVRFKGAPQNPARFLEHGQANLARIAKKLK